MSNYLTSCLLCPSQQPVCPQMGTKRNNSDDEFPLLSHLIIPCAVSWDDDLTMCETPSYTIRSAWCVGHTTWASETKTKSNRSEGPKARRVVNRSGGPEGLQTSSLRYLLSIFSIAALLAGAGVLLSIYSSAVCCRTNNIGHHHQHQRRTQDSSSSSEPGPSGILEFAEIMLNIM